ncbi:nucleoside deaminase [Blastococcus sp. VKM Ac-2987]|uniref:nucleoside deaminase n=1 Tax=Blastococcus sp. VKM Ac-2987 TaxID=3004141 RepID=UPI0022AB5A1F|nr:nucleoside deaminase [Blastococcus sp. VKM Ac-2987]MCZ2860765.1 nucleoside deaminase [Blastococcus sp. VKM Ac-2987]
MMSAVDEKWLQQAVELATANVAAGGGPFGAVIVRGDVVVATGVNRVTRDLDPTAHAEVTAIRAACRELGDFALGGCTLYTSCEPCPMCATSALWARLDRVVFAANRHDAADGGFDDRAFYDLLSSAPMAWPTSVQELRLGTAVAPFLAWRENPVRVDY